MATTTSRCESPNLKPEGFRIKRRDDADKSQLDVIALDPAGLMYGGLEVAEVCSHGRIRQEILCLVVEHLNNEVENATDG